MGRNVFLCFQPRISMSTSQNSFAERSSDHCQTQMAGLGVAQRLKRSLFTFPTHTVFFMLFKKKSKDVTSLHSACVRKVKTKRPNASSFSHICQRQLMVCFSGNPQRSVWERENIIRWGNLQLKWVCVDKNEQI